MTAPTADLLCSSCQQPVQANRRRRDRAAAGRAVYCSRECQKRGNTTERACEADGCTTVVRRANSRMYERTFCSTTCRNRALPTPNPRNGTTGPCEVCGVDVYRAASQAQERRFCSTEHRGQWMRGREQVERIARPCAACGTTMRLTPWQANAPGRFQTCSADCASAARCTKARTRVKDAETGYVWLYVQDGVRVLEHRHVMEQHLGRPLTEDETVHHKTGGFEGRSNNDLSNLELWSGRHPKGHRVEDIVAYSLDTLALYAPERLTG